jgi:hypothetical protein
MEVQYLLKIGIFAKDMRKTLDDPPPHMSFTGRFGISVGNYYSSNPYFSIRIDYTKDHQGASVLTGSRI